MEHKRSYGVKDTIETVLVPWKNIKTIEKKDTFICHGLKLFFEQRKGRKIPLGDIAMYPVCTNILEKLLGKQNHTLDVQIQLMVKNGDHEPVCFTSISKICISWQTEKKAVLLKK